MDQMWAWRERGIKEDGCLAQPFLVASVGFYE